jgi:hypothetical protein
MNLLNFSFHETNKRAKHSKLKAVSLSVRLWMINCLHYWIIVIHQFQNISQLISLFFDKSCNFNAFEDSLNCLILPLFRKSM